MNKQTICLIVMSAIRKMRQGNGQIVIVVMDGAILAWVNRESFSEKVTSKQESE